MHSFKPWIRVTWHVLALSAILGLLLLRLAGPKAADHSGNYPRRPIKVIVPFGPGGASDTLVRVMQKAIADNRLLDQPLVVINRGGGSATIGSRSVRTARPDGYTLLNLHDSIFTARLSGKVPYGPEAFEPIAATGRVPLVVVVPAGSPYRTLRDLLEASRNQPSTIVFGTNLGAPAHFAGLLLEKAMEGALFRYVQSGGGQQRYTKLLGGHLDVGVFSIDEFVAYGADGRIRALAVLSGGRPPSLQDIPTALEQGFNVVQHNTQYWWAPRGTPPSRIRIFADALERAMDSHAARSWFEQSHTQPVFLRGSALDQMLQARAEDLSLVDLRRPDTLPNFPLIVGCALVILFLWVALVAQAKSGRAEAAAAMSQPGRAVCLIGLVLLYVWSMEWRLLGFAWTSAAFVFASGVVLGRRRPEQLLVLAQLALICGLGTERLFTEVFVIDLPVAE